MKSCYHGWTCAIIVFLAQVVGAAQPYGLEARQPVGAYLNGKMPELGPGISGNWSTLIAFPGVSFKNALGLCPLPGSSRLIVVRPGGCVEKYALLLVTQVPAPLAPAQAVTSQR